MNFAAGHPSRASLRFEPIILTARGVIAKRWPHRLCPDRVNARETKTNCQRTPGCSITIVTEYNQPDLKTPSFLTILCSTSSVVNSPWSRTERPDYRAMSNVTVTLVAFEGTFK